MYKFYWNNLPKSHGETGGGGGGGGNGQCAPSRDSRERGEGGGRSVAPQSHCVHQRRRQRDGDRDKGEEFGAVAAPPDLPARCQAQGVTVRVRSSQEREEEGDSAEEEGEVNQSVQRTPQSQKKGVRKQSAYGGGGGGGHPPPKVGGSHRVLLRLRRISSSGGGGGRPKSVSDASEVEGGGEDEVQREKKKSTSKNRQEKSSPDMSRSTNATTTTMRGSRSMHHFHSYNKTWNERSLTKYSADYAYLASESFHDYENVYSGNNDYEDEDEEEEVPPPPPPRAVHPDQVSCTSGASSVSRRKQFLLSVVRQTGGRMRGRRRKESVDSVAATEEAEGPSSTLGALYRSRSCERPKMREAFRDMQQNINRLSSNLADRVAGKLQQHQQQHQQQRRHRRQHKRQQQQQQQQQRMSHSMSSCQLSGGGLSFADDAADDDDQVQQRGEKLSVRLLHQSPSPRVPALPIADSAADNSHCSAAAPPPVADAAVCGHTQVRYSPPSHNHFYLFFPEHEKSGSGRKRLTFVLSFFPVDCGVRTSCVCVSVFFFLGIPFFFSPSSCPTHPLLLPGTRN